MQSLLRCNKTPAELHHAGFIYDRVKRVSTLLYQEIDWFGSFFQQNKFLSLCSRVCVLLSLARLYNCFYINHVNTLLHIKCRYFFLLLNPQDRHRNFTSRHQLQNVEDYPHFPMRPRKQKISQGHCFLLVKIKIVTCLKTLLHIVSLQGSVTNTCFKKFIYTGCPRRNVPDFGRVFLMLKYTDITQNTYIQS